MAIGTTLANMVTMLRAELRDSIASGHQPDWQPMLREALRSAQDTLWLTEDWPHLKIKDASFSTAGTTRFYSMSGTALGQSSLRQVDVRWQGKRTPLAYGIDTSHYDQLNPSLAGDARDPAQRYDFAFVGGETVLELWPVPATNTQVVLLSGQAALGAFNEDHHTCTLDDRLIVLHAKADLLAARGAKDAERAAAKASAYLDLLRGFNKSAQLNAASYRLGAAPRRSGPRVIRASP